MLRDKTQDVLRDARKHLAILDPERGEQELIEAVAVEVAALGAIGSTGAPRS